MKQRNLAVAAMMAALTATAQQPVAVGDATYAAYPPAYKAQTADHAGFQATKMLTRKLYVDEREGRPLPTNDWWTDVIANRFSGAMWSYPAMLRTAEEGVTLCYPTRWSDDGTEVKSDTWIRIGGETFEAAEARATDWHDWDVEIDLPSATGPARIKATLVHGSPFSWFEFEGDVEPQVAFSAAATIVKCEKESMLVRVGGDHYALYYPSATKPDMHEGLLTLDGAAWVSAAPVADVKSYEAFKPYAASIVRATTVSWDYDEKRSLLSTHWAVRAENLRDGGAAAPVLQGFLPHVYRHAELSDLSYDGTEYLTPRGKLRLAVSPDGRFGYSYRFAGMLPSYAAPGNEGYDPALMDALMEEYATGGSFGDDTYWGGKGLTQMALNMTFAKQTGRTELYELSKKKLRDVMENWLNYTPGESTKFFAYYPRWGGMLGFDVSYDSDAFNDHHFHYGYYIYAAALLCMEDSDFAEGYGEMLRMIVKDYANYDRTDTRFPFLRTLDPWAGHSYAGGLGDHGNDNGNGQESSSEAMQSWGGMFLLGVALGDTQMRDAGLFGWLTESRAVGEYWFDRDRKNYDYTRYQHPYNSNLTSKGIGWWTWFSGDPLWMHSIQWMPVSPCLNYLSEDLKFAKWDFETMMAKSAYGWFDGAEPLADQSVGNVALCYMERYDPAGALEIFNRARREGYGIAKNVDTGHISYYVINSHLTYGDIDFGVSADCPTAQAYRKADGTMTYIVYNPGAQDRDVTFSRGATPLRTVKAPGRRLTAFTADARPTELRLSTAKGLTLPPGTKEALTIELLDQYGAHMEPGNVSYTAGNGASVSADGVLAISAAARRGSSISLTATARGVKGEVVVIVNDVPVAASTRIAGLPELIEAGFAGDLTLEVTDQYGKTSRPDARWEVRRPDGTTVAACGGRVIFDRAGGYTVSATVGDVKASVEVPVMPVLPDVARNATASASSEENVGTLAAGAIDGDPETRWGSQHTDHEWFMVDLGRPHKITSVTIDWEAAYAADYDLEVSDDARTWTVMASQRALSAPGRVRHAVAAEGRYVRVNCLRRATQYGYSIVDMTIGGVDAAAAATTAVGLEIDAPEVMSEGSACTLGATTFALNGTKSAAKSVEWSSEPAGRFDGNRFTPQTYGPHTITARTGALSATAQVVVEESVKLSSLSVEPQSAMVLTGDAVWLTVEGVDQFGGVYPVDAAGIDVQIEPEGASFNVATGEFCAANRGDYTLTFNGGMAVATVAVRDVGEANLAAGKRTRASSALGGNTAAMAVDLTTETRWESEHRDGEWISVDLGEMFRLNRVVIDWEGAYAAEYDIETSTDGATWFAVVSERAGKGGVETAGLPDVPARYVRVNCLRRATAYGNSIRELQVYGSERFGETNTGRGPAIGDMELTTGNGSISGTLTLPAPAFTTVSVRDADGIERGRTSAYGKQTDFGFSGLMTGRYSLTATARDAFGNESSESRELEVTYDVRGINVALGCPATASSAENDALGARYAVDGDTSTRWGSGFADGESLTVDLENTYLVNRVVVKWNSPAFATDYVVETSADGETFAEAFSRTGWDGGNDDATFEPAPARFVRLTGLLRATPYGTSIDELEVYALELLEVKTGIGVIEHTGAQSDAVYYDLQGRRVVKPRTGIFISAGRKRLVR